MGWGVYIFILHATFYSFHVHVPWDGCFKMGNAHTLGTFYLQNPICIYGVELLGKLITNDVSQDYTPDVTLGVTIYLYASYLPITCDCIPFRTSLTL